MLIMESLEASNKRKRAQTLASDAAPREYVSPYATLPEEELAECFDRFGLPQREEEISDDSDLESDYIDGNLHAFWKEQIASMNNGAIILENLGNANPGIPPTLLYY